MSGFWEAVVRDVHELALVVSKEGLRDAVAGIESSVAKTVVLVTGDREFPADLRETIMASLAVYPLDYNWTNDDLPRHAPNWNADAEDYLVTNGFSRLLEELHRHFQELAGRKIVHRFGGVFTNDPAEFLKARDAATE